MKTKRYVLVATALFVTMLAHNGSVQAQVSIGTVDIQRVRDDARKFKKALAEINDMVEEFERRRDRQTEQLKGLSEDLQDAEQRGFDGTSERLRKELQSKSMEFKEFMQETFGQDGIIESKSEELLAPLYDKLTIAAKKVAETRGLDLILDLEQVNPLFSSDSLDVTDDVLAEFEKLW